MIGEVVLGGRPGRRVAPTVGYPLAEGQPGGNRPPPAVLAYAQHRCVQGVARPGDPRILVVPGRGGAGRVERRPHRLPGGADAGRAASAERGVGERGHQHGAEEMGEAPARPVVVGRRPRGAGVQTDLHGRRAAHHRSADRAYPVEVLLHGGVTGQRQQPSREVPGVVSEPDESEPVTVQPVTDGGQVGGHGLHALGQRVGGRGAELQLATGLLGERGAEREAPQVGEGGVHTGRADGPRGVDFVVDKPLQFHTDPLRRAVLEADAVRPRLGLRLIDRQDVVHSGTPSRRSGSDNHSTAPRSGRYRTPFYEHLFPYHHVASPRLPARGLINLP